VYAINGNPVELYFALMFGVLGFIFRKVDIPLAPMVLSLVLGGIMEQSFRQAMTISGGNPRIFVGSTICVVLVALSVFSIFLPFILDRMKRLDRSPKASAA
jgi:putative tricarboxylic transport membrane protein